jgi:DNA-binding transcriptional LysR family regulator
MELRQLDAFVAVAEERNFTRAAARLYVAQSGLSATIRSLERELQAPLFLRTTRRVELTAAGAALLGEARRTLASAVAAAEAVAAVEGLRHGTLTLGIIQATSLFDLPGLLAVYRRTYPGIELKLQQASSAELGRLLDDHRVDIVFRTEFDEGAKDLVSIPLAGSPLVFVCHPDDALAGHPVVNLRALSGRALVGFPLGWGVRTLSDLAFVARGVEPHYGFEVNDTQTLLDLVEVGLGPSVLPAAIATPRGPRLRQIPIGGRRWVWTLTAQTLAPGSPNPAAQALWTMLAEQAPDQGHKAPESRIPSS